MPERADTLEAIGLIMFAPPLYSMVSALESFPSCAKKLLDFPQHFYETVNFFGRIVKVKTGAGRGFDAEFAHERLVAVMPPAQGHATLVGDGHQIVRVHVFEQEADQPRPPDVRPEEAQAVEAREPGERMGAQFLIVVRDVLAPDFVE